MTEEKKKIVLCIIFEFYDHGSYLTCKELVRYVIKVKMDFMGKINLTWKFLNNLIVSYLKNVTMVDNFEWWEKIF